jgi:hypothetical protein
MVRAGYRYSGANHKFGADAGDEIIWSQIAPGEHIAQLYADDTALIDTLTGFVEGGLSSGESAVVIATREHLRELYHRLPDAGVDMQRVLLEDRFITLDANMALACFMVRDWPDEQLFGSFVETLIRRAARHNRRVRAFGEMVALLWSQGHHGATLRLEHLWNRFCQSHSFALLCSYPTAGFTNNPLESLSEICAAHSRVI